MFSRSQYKRANVQMGVRHSPHGILPSAAKSPAPLPSMVAGLDAKKQLEAARAEAAAEAAALAKQHQQALEELQARCAWVGGAMHFLRIRFWRGASDHVTWSP